jgi:hypothetical protein
VFLAGISVPAAVRVNVLTTSTSVYGDYVYASGSNDPADPGRLYVYGSASGTATGSIGDLALPSLLYIGGYDYGSLSGQFEIQVATSTPFWTDFTLAAEVL